MTLLKTLQTPVFKAEGIPQIKEKEYRLTVKGMVKEEKVYSMKDIRNMPFTGVNARLVSVSGFSVRAPWEGVLWQDFNDHLFSAPEATHVIFRSAGGYETCLSLETLSHPRVLLVYAVGGEPLEREYGAPLRLLVPHRWGYKSCKWLREIIFTDQMTGGYWEDRGYSNEGLIEPGTTYDLNSGERRSLKGGEVTDY